MQDYFIEKLKKVSFDRTLFLKEFQKSRRWLKQDELANVEQWARLHHLDKLEQTGEKTEAVSRKQADID